eukprot:1161512-Pelagomonas_calceolata.AAC.4
MPLDVLVHNCLPSSSCMPSLSAQEGRRQHGHLHALIIVLGTCMHGWLMHWAPTCTAGFALGTYMHRALSWAPACVVGWCTGYLHSRLVVARGTCMHGSKGEAWMKDPGGLNSSP